MREGAGKCCEFLSFKTGNLFRTDYQEKGGRKSVMRIMETSEEKMVIWNHNPDMVGTMKWLNSG